MGKTDAVMLMFAFGRAIPVFIQWVSILSHLLTCMHADWLAIAKHLNRYNYSIIFVHRLQFIKFITELLGEKTKNL